MHKINMNNKKIYGTLPKNNTLKQTCVLVTDANEIEDISGSVSLESGSVISSIANNQNSGSITSLNNPKAINNNTILNEMQGNLLNNSLNKSQTSSSNANTTSTANSSNLDTNKLQPGVIPTFVNKKFHKLVRTFASCLNLALDLFNIIDFFFLAYAYAS
jgi:hypothetical protein